MTRGIKRAFHWRFPLWLRNAPGKKGAAVFLLAPVAFLLPLEHSGILSSRVQSISALVWLLAMALPLSVRGQAGLRESYILWLFQRGCGPGDVALEDWMLDLGLFFAFALWWAGAGVMALAMSHPVSPANLLSLLLLGSSVAVLTHSVTFLFSAWGSSRTSDPVAFLAFLSVLLPTLTMDLPEWVFTAADWLIPPFHSAMILSGTVRTGLFPEAASALLHILLYSGVAVGLGYRRMSLWRP